MPNYLTVIEAESERFLTSVLAAAPDAPVPTCPDWTAGDLLWHLTEVHAYWAGILRSGAVTEEESDAVDAAKPQRPADREAIVEVFREQTADLLAQLRRRKDDEPAWFWLDTAQTVGSTRRMQAHEATMHRLDAEFAAGLDPSPVSSPELAMAGLVHGVEVMWAWWGTLPGFALVPSGGAVELFAEDLGESYLVQPGRWRGVGQSGTSYDEPGAVAAPGVEPAARITGTAEQLYRWLWGRGDQPAASGDQATLDAFIEARNQGMN
jgi:uncharacterized protein (TIGR03083 family)